MKLKSLYISPLEIEAGAVTISFGFMQLLKRNYKRVGFFRPIVKYIPNNDIELIVNNFKLDIDKKDCIGIDVQKAEQLISNNKISKLYEIIINRYENISSKYDFVLIQGVSRDSLNINLDFDINLEIAKNLNTAVVGVLNGKNKDFLQVKNDILVEANNIKKVKCKHFATFVNRVTSCYLDDLYKIDTTYKLFCIPEKDELSAITVRDIKESLNAKVVIGDKADYSKTIKNVKVAAMSFDNYLVHIEDRDLIIVPADRSDIIIGSIAALHSKTVPTISCILMTGDIKLKKQIKELLIGLDTQIPILKVKENTFDIAKKVLDIKGTISYENNTKTSLIIGIFNQYVDIEAIEKHLLLESNNIITPLMFEYSLLKKASLNKKTIVLPEATDDRILKASEILLNSDIVNIILLGNIQEINHKASLIDVDISKAIIIDPKESEHLKQFSEILYELRKHKGATKEKTLDVIQTNYNYFATMMVHLNFADGMVSGSISTTADTVRPALQIIKTKPNTTIVSSVFFMCLETEVLVYGDCAINPEPSENELAQIAISSATTAKMFNIEPKIAMLSYSTGESGSGDEVTKVKNATNIVKKESDFIVEGPIQYDAAIIKSVAQAKLPNSKVAGDANVLIFPNLNTGNNTYKAVQRSSGAVAVGPILQGLNKPINDLSRGCLVSDIVNTIAITAIQAQYK
ncbi:MAG: phosphate acetyltransferase [Campylobacterota bacterium]|nr:phosphate acetyltransferase [Campylobacterota bacterium]